jgi:hypothetical protein
MERMMDGGGFGSTDPMVSGSEMGMDEERPARKRARKTGGAKRRKKATKARRKKAGGKARGRTRAKARKSSKRKKARRR